MKINIKNEVTPEVLKEIIKINTLTDNPFPLCIWGEPGIGKTEIVKQVCLENDFEYIYQTTAQWVDPGDITGIPYKDVKANGDFITRFAKQSWFPFDLEEGKKGVILFDDFNRANTEIIQALMQVLQLKVCGGYYFPKGWYIVLSANPDNNVYNVNSIDDATLTRMINLHLSKNIGSWKTYAYENNIHPMVIEFFTVERPFAFDAYPPRVLTTLSTQLYCFEKSKGSDEAINKRVLRALVYAILNNQNDTMDVGDAVAISVDGTETSVSDGTYAADFISHYEQRYRFMITLEDIMNNTYSNKIDDALKSGTSGKFAIMAAGYKIIYSMKKTGILLQDCITEDQINNVVDFVFKYANSDIKSSFIDKYNMLPIAATKLRNSIKNNVLFQEYQKSRTAKREVSFA
jgi:hypothetical protein